MRVHVVLNAQAGALLRGTRQGAIDTVAAAFARAGLTPRVDCVDPAALDEVIDAEAAKTEVVVVGGGDGTLRSAAARLAGRAAALGVLPLGTFNHFAKDIGIPLDLDGAARAIAEGTAQPRDIAAVNGRVFINHAGVGLYPHMVELRERLRGTGRLGKFPAMAIAILDMLRSYPTFGLRIRVAGETRTRRSPFLFVANNQYILDAYGLDRPDSSDKLTLLLAHDAGRRALFRMGVKALLGRLGKDAYDAFAFERAVIDSRRERLLVELDGEIEALKPPLEFTLMPGALRVVRPGGIDVGTDRRKLEGMERPAA
jgi:diacylglycerol kinase family enzyme